MTDPELRELNEAIARLHPDFEISYNTDPPSEQWNRKNPDGSWTVWTVDPPDFTHDPRLALPLLEEILEWLRAEGGDFHIEPRGDSVFVQFGIPEKFDPDTLGCIEAGDSWEAEGETLLIAICLATRAWKEAG